MAREDQADAARAAMHERLERQVDPFGELPPDERDRRVRSAARALSAKLNLAKASKRKRTRLAYQRLLLDVEDGDRGTVDLGGASRGPGYHENRNAGAEQAESFSLGLVRHPCGYQVAWINDRNLARRHGCHERADAVPSDDEAFLP